MGWKKWVTQIEMGKKYVHPENGWIFFFLLLNIILLPMALSFIFFVDFIQCEYVYEYVHTDSIKLW